MLQGGERTAWTGMVAPEVGTRSGRATQFAFYSRLEVWGGSKVPILSYLGKPLVKGISSKAAEGYSVNARNQKVLMSNSATLDTARVSNVQRCNY